jgi:uncharacterized membrane protein
VDDNKPLKVKVSNNWGASPSYTFEAKDNITLQILANQRLKKWQLALLITTMAVLVIVIGVFLKKWMIFFQSLLLVALLINFIITRNRFIIQEINTENNR